MEWVVLLIVIVIVGALLGGDFLGEIVRGGCGCLAAGVVVLAVLLWLNS